MTRKNADADELAQTIEQLSDSERELVANFIEALAQSEDDEVENFKKGLVSGTTKREKAAAREKAYEDMSLEDQKRAFFGFETSGESESEKADADDDVKEATDKFRKGAAQEY